MVKGFKLKENQRERKIRSPDPAILGRVRTRDPDPGHFGPDFDSGSGHGSAFTDPGPGARLKARTFWTICGLSLTFTDSFGLDWYLRRYARVCGLKGGELLLKSGLKQEKLSVLPRYF
jgi:hypothetical protein